MEVLEDKFDQELERMIYSLEVCSHTQHITVSGSSIWAQLLRYALCSNTQHRPRHSLLGLLVGPWESPSAHGRPKHTTPAWHELLGYCTRQCHEIWYAAIKAGPLLQCIMAAPPSIKHHVCTLFFRSSECGICSSCTTAHG